MPEGQKAGPKGRQQEVGAQGAPRLLITNNNFRMALPANNNIASAAAALLDQVLTASNSALAPPTITVGFGGLLVILMLELEQDTSV